MPTISKTPICIENLDFFARAQKNEKKDLTPTFLVMYFTSIALMKLCVKIFSYFLGILLFFVVWSFT